MGKTTVIYPGLRAEMARHKMAVEDVGKQLGLSHSAMSLKLSGKRTLSIAEAKRIRDELFPDMSLDDLFESEDKD